MDKLVFTLVILGSLLAIVSGIWVAYALGNAISPFRKKQNSLDASENSKDKFIRDAGIQSDPYLRHDKRDIAQK